MTDNLIDSKDSAELDPSKNYLTELVGDGKKFKTPEDLAYGKAQSDSYIRILTRQLDDLKSDYEKARSEAASRARLEELVEKLNNPVQPTPVTETSKPEINMTDIESLVSKKIQETETQRRQKENYDMVKAELTKKFGDNLEYHLKEVGLDGESAAQLAKVNPQLVLKALGAEKQQEGTFMAPPRNTSVQSPNRNAPQRTWSYYQEMFKNNPSLKMDSKINVQMQQDYIKLGNTFEDGDFHRFG
jgi:PHD/YefM family antitoxin component YafN of YafNO toxin-antitoxin module